jgi:3-oxoacyl-[acyl-carrier protein] reductase
MQITLENEIALITGADRGIGFAIMNHLGKMGATVIGTGIVKEAAESIEEHLKNENIKGTGVVLNVCDAEQVQTVIKEIQQGIGTPTILVNNAGITKDNILLRMKDDQWNDVIDTNLNGIFRITRACLKPMIKLRRGRIISISSVVGAIGNFGQSNYAASKAGLIGFNKSLAREVAPYGITANVVAPGFIDTAMTQKISEEKKEALFKMIPMKRLGQPADIANAVGFLASSQAAYITGETLHINGGMNMA